MTYEFRWWRDISIYALSVAAIVSMVIVAWSTRSALNSLHEYQNSLMENEGRSVSEEISLYVKERTRLLGLFAEQNADLLHKYIADGENSELKDHLSSLIRKHFPNYFAFTIRTADNQLVPDDLGEFVGDICRVDIEQFWATRSLTSSNETHAYSPFIHPQAGNYHFDMMTHWETVTGEEAILFVSFHPVQLAKIISNYELPGHRVVLVRNDQKDLIEITSKGARDTLGEHIRLDSTETDQIVHQLPIKNTRWVTLVMPEAGFMQAQEWVIYRLAFIELTGVFLFWLGAMWFMTRTLREKHRAYVTIEEQTERLMSSQQVAHVGSWDWNIITGTLEWTDEIYRIFGRSRDDFGSTYENFVQCIHPDDRAQIISAVNNSVASNEPYDVEHRIVLPDNTVRHVHEKGKVYRDEKGQPFRMLGTVQDITERKKVRDRLRQNEKELHRHIQDLEMTKANMEQQAADLVELAEELHIEKERAEKLSITDRLTGLNNRLKLDEFLADEMNRAKRYKHHLSVIIFDLDHFKQVNDTYGHQVGDEILVSVADLTRENTRTSDVAGRWGGEEFMIICPETELSGAKVIAEKLRQVIERYDFPTVGHKTASFGVASVKSDENEDGVMQRADDALYRAKNAGRNRVEVDS